MIPKVFGNSSISLMISPNNNTGDKNIKEFTQYFKDLGTVTSKAKNSTHHENILKNLHYHLKKILIIIIVH